MGGIINFSPKLPFSSIYESYYMEKLLVAEKELEFLRDFVRDIRDNYDHDDDAHRYRTRCRACEAEKLLLKR